MARESIETRGPWRSRPFIAPSPPGRTGARRGRDRAGLLHGARMSDPPNPRVAASEERAPSAPLRSVALALAWVGAAGCAFVGLVLGEAYATGLVGAPGPAMAYLTATGAAVAAALGAVLGVLHGVERLLPPRARALGSTLLGGAAAAGALWPLAVELGAGDGVAPGRVDAVRWGSFALLEGAVAAAWLWHRAMVRRRDEPIAPARRALRVALWCGGLLAALGAFELLVGGLRAYAFLVGFVASLFVVVVGTAAFALVARLPRVAAVFGVAWLLFVGVAAGAALAGDLVVAEAREIVLPVSQVASRFDRFVWDAPPGLVFRLDDPSRFRCDADAPPEAEGPYAHPRVGPRHALVVSIDTLRSDAVDWEHRGRAVMPNLREFARGSVFAPRALSPYPATLFAVESALTGLHPSRVLFAPSPPPTVFTLAAGGGVAGEAILPDDPWFRRPVAQRLYVQRAHARRAPDAQAQVGATIEVLERARARGQSSVVWLHLFEPHHPNPARPGFAFGDDARGRYMGELAYVDAQLGALFRWLRESGAYEDTLVVVFSDHGESLGERAYFGHHVYLNGWLTEVPLAVRAPGMPPRRVRGVAELTDVAATVAHFFGVPMDTGSSGRSLLAGDPPRDRVVVSEAFPIRGGDVLAERGAVQTQDALSRRLELTRGTRLRYPPKVSLVDAGYRLIVEPETGAKALYDRRRDRREEVNLVSREPRRVARMMAYLVEWHRRTSEAIYCAGTREPTSAAPQASAARGR